MICIFQCHMLCKHQLITCHDTVLRDETVITLERRKPMGRLRDLLKVTSQSLTNSRTAKKAANLSQVRTGLAKTPS